MSKLRTKKEVLTKMLTEYEPDIYPLPESTEAFVDFMSESENKEEEEEDYQTETYTEEISFIELAILNSFLYSCYKGKFSDLMISSYGKVDNVGRLEFGGSFDNTNHYWFHGKVPTDIENEYIFQTRKFVNGHGETYINFVISCKKGMEHGKFTKFYKDILKLAFNNSEYKGKCIKAKLFEGTFKGIEIIDVKTSSNELILNEVQRKFIEHFISRVERGGTARYLLNGEPGTGKTESIREIARKLMPSVTFIIPDFYNSNDLITILEACEIFEQGVIIMDDIDLYLGSRENGSYTRLLGEFLSFFDGVKKRKISLLASTNDKGLVDRAAERPGRFNFTLDYGFLGDEDIVKVCNIHLPEKWRIKEVFDSLTGTINGKKAKITGAFIANLADNIKEMSEGDEEWGLEDTISLIKESYRGFYSSQVEREKQSMGFKI